MTEDEMDFASRKYSHRFLWVGLLDSGLVAIADESRKLSATFYLAELPLLLQAHLKAAYERPLPEYVPPQAPVTLRDLDELDLDLKI